MSNFPVNYPKGLNDDLISRSILLPTWSHSLHPEIQIQSIDIKTADIFPGNRIGFFESDVNYKIPSNNQKNDFLFFNERIMMSGGSASIIVLIKCIETNDIYTVLVQQPRIGSGGLQFEYPAGLTDDSTDFRSTAARELEEECGISLNENDLENELLNISEMVNGNDDKYFTNAKMFFEATSMFLVRKKMKFSQIKELEGRYGGVDEEEQITNHIFLFDEVINVSKDPTTLSITYIVQKLMKTGKIIF
ncbi:hydrolase, NUDIX family protein [Tritrichomonas foetus]|uniref:Hydrolase, NUDIX family protein n=1 Tax=Tritrichomonas foetus TaxID=1144522 RepID=A0A1J4JDW4_9EUKA|nr:hydrolase, NUDIX family protein [Tritrichomonas foetus]|eukprot:OHS95629.1 hydrolase, NUDIX family protein [Tritrichomonas foetus]